MILAGLIFAAYARRLPRLLLLGLLLLDRPPAGASEAPRLPPATVAVSGLGWFRDRELKRALERLPGAPRGTTLEANAVEEALFLLMAAVQDEGFLQPRIVVTGRAADGTGCVFTADADLTTPVPRGGQWRTVNFRILPGVRSFVQAVTFTGRSVVSAAVARRFFPGRAALLAGKAERAYTPARIARGLEALQAEYRSLGYADASATVARLDRDERTGAVALAVAVTEGARWWVRTVRIDTAGIAAIPARDVQRWVEQPWTEALAQRLAREWQGTCYALGYADARVRVTRVAGAPREGRRDVAVTVHLRPGDPVRLGPIRFEGAEHVQATVLQRRVAVSPGEPLNPLLLEQARYRLARLGVFEQVELRYEPAQGAERSPVFTVREGRSLETNLMLGYGSYEQVRGAVEVRQFNLFGRAHQSRALLAQSMKSTRGEYAYTVPEIFGESIDGTAKVFGLQRAELAFQRQEYGAKAALSLPLGWLGANATAGYTYQLLRNRQNELATRAVDDPQVAVASLDAGLTRDRRDNPLRPRRGYRWFAQVEAASRSLGGDAEFQRGEAGGAYHTRWGDGRWLHAACTHGVITTWGTSDRRLPVNKRFFPGGGSSIRGYREGEAAPRSAAGRFIGAKGYTLANLDLEQALTSQWSLVVFGDALTTAAELRHYPLGGEQLYSAGLGLRYQTLIGPIRVEHGRNLHPRPGDPGGTWQISVGASF